MEVVVLVGGVVVVDLVVVLVAVDVDVDVVGWIFLRDLDDVVFDERIPAGAQA